MNNRIDSRVDNLVDNPADNRADNKVDNCADDLNEKKMCCFKRKKDVNDKKFHLFLKRR